ncbi:MAG: alanyl-tRNA editing protein [Clostridiales bacterium]|nr:alanyl-tRNA editing protein [Clostridiales bacterium]
MKTKPLYLNDCYIHQFQADITEIGDDFIVLNETYFYSRGGGQPGDTGDIAGIVITDTKRDGDGKILHYFEGDCNLSSGQSVQCHIDWPRRYAHMRIHSASHIVEYFLFRHSDNQKFLSSFISGGKETSTYEVTAAITPEIVEKIQHDANAFIKGNHDILLYPDENNPDYRYCKIGDIVYPCGGTHPKNTSEIGEISIKVKGQAALGKQKIVTTLMP